MKNFKRLVAGTIAATMALALSVSAFAETTFTPGAENIATLTYDATNNAIGLPATVGEGEDAVDNRAFMSADGQITVVLATTADANSGTLDGTTIQYINQGVKNDDFWASMGVKDALAPDTEYTLRVGTHNASGEWDIEELTFTLVETEEGVTILWGDIDLSTEVDANDAGAILKALAGGKKTFGDYTVKEAFVSTYLWGDVDLSTEVDANDAGAILKALAGGKKTFGDFTIKTECVVK